MNFLHVPDFSFVGPCHNSAVVYRETTGVVVDVKHLLLLLLTDQYPGYGAAGKCAKPAKAIK